MKQQENLPTWGIEKKQTFESIKKFYEKVILFPEEILSSIIFYGGTSTYIGIENIKVTREFGDIDWVVAVDKIKMVRDYLNSLDDFIIQYDGTAFAKENNIESSDGINEFGFKGSLFGRKLSLHPISETSDNKILSKWIKVEDNKIDLIANTLMVENCCLNDLITQIKFQNKSINILKHELNIAWKKRRMESHDEEDINFMLKHKEELGIDEKTIKFFLDRMPKIDVITGYKKTQDGIELLASGLYEEF